VLDLHIAGMTLGGTRGHDFCVKTRGKFVALHWPTVCHSLL